MGNKPPSSTLDESVVIDAALSAEKIVVADGSPSSIAKVKDIDFDRPLTQFQIHELRNELQRLSRVEQEAELFKQEIFHLKAEFEQMCDTRSRGLDESSLRRETVTLKESLGQLKHEMNHLEEREKKCAVIERTFASWKEDLDEQTKELDALRESSAAEIAILRSQVTKMSEASFGANQNERELKAMSTTIEQLKAENLKLVEELAHSKPHFDKEQELTVATTEIKVLKDLLESFMGEISRCKVDLEAAKDTEKTLQDQLNMVNKDFQGAVFEIAQLKLKNSMDADKLDLLTAENARLNHGNELTGQIDSVANASRIGELEKEVLELKTRLDISNAEILRLKSFQNDGNTASEAELLSLQSKVMISDELRVKLSTEVVQLRDVVEKDKFDIEMLKSSIASANATTESYKAEITRLTSQLESSKDFANSAQQAQLELSRLQKVEKILEKKIIRLQKENENLTEATRSLDALKLDLEKGKEESGRYEAKIQALLQELESTRNTVTKQEAELNVLSSKTEGSSTSSHSTSIPSPGVEITSGIEPIAQVEGSVI